MTIHFYLRFYTHFGQTLLVSGDIDALGNDKIAVAFPLHYKYRIYRIAEIYLF